MPKKKKSKRKSWVPVAKIKNNLRRLSLQRKEYKQKKDSLKVDKATYSCEHCDVYIYEGSSEKNFNELKEKYAPREVIWDKLALDHIDPVVEVGVGFTDWNTYIERLWCDPANYQGLCKNCHQVKSSGEMEERAEAGSLKRKK